MTNEFYFEDYEAVGMGNLKEIKISLFQILPYLSNFDSLQFEKYTFYFNDKL